MHGRPLFPGPNARHARPCTTLSSFYILSLAALLPHPLHAHAHSDASAPLADAAFSGCSARREAAIAAVCTGTTADTALKGVASFVPVSLSPGHEHEGAADDCCPLLLPACLPPPAACLPALSSCLPACPLQLPACLPSSRECPQRNQQHLQPAVAFSAGAVPPPVSAATPTGQPSGGSGDGSCRAALSLHQPLHTSSPHHALLATAMAGPLQLPPPLL